MKKKKIKKKKEKKKKEKKKKKTKITFENTNEKFWFPRKFFFFYLPVSPFFSPKHTYINILSMI